MRILITGSSGFIGSYIVQEALNHKLDVYAGIRKTSNKQHLTDSRIKFLELNLSNNTSLEATLKEFKETVGDLDYIVHNAGVTKVVNVEDFNTVNYQYTRNFVEALRKAGHNIKKFVFISTLAASGPGAEDGTAMKPSDQPHPIDAYGKSKLLAEEYLRSLTDVPHVILRPTGVFGPRDKDMFSFFDLINKKLEVHIGVNKQFLSLIYVKDLARAVIKACVSPMGNKTYFISDNNKYDNFIFSNAIKNSLGKKTFVIKLPVFLLYLAAFIAQSVSKISGKPSPLNLEKVKILKARNWYCDSTPFYRDMNFVPGYTLNEAIAETVDWYKKENWL